MKRKQQANADRGAHHASPLLVAKRRETAQHDRVQPALGEAGDDRDQREHRHVMPEFDFPEVPHQQRGGDDGEQQSGASRRGSGTTALPRSAAGPAWAVSSTFSVVAGSAVAIGIPPIWSLWRRGASRRQNGAALR